MKRLIITTLVLLLVAAGGAVAQEAPDENSEVLTRYDSAETQAEAQEYRAMLAEREAFLEERDTASWDTSDETNSLADARLRDIEDAPLPDEPEARAQELRRKAQTLYALQDWAENSGTGVDANSELHNLMGSAPADELGDEFRAQADELDSQAAEPEPQEEPDSGDEAAGGDGGGSADEGSSDRNGLIQLAGGVVGLIFTLILLTIILSPILLVGGIYLLYRRGVRMPSTSMVGQMVRGMKEEGIRPLSFGAIPYVLGFLWVSRGSEPSPGGGPTVGGPEEQGGGGTRPQQRRTGRREMTPELRAKLQNLAETMHDSIVGQEAAVAAVSNALRRRLAGGFGGDRPASFLFLGPTGVGKTEVTKVLADVMYEGESSTVRLDMAEYSEKHVVQRLTGAPPGYVGYEEGGQLTNPLIENSERVVLMDEIEKAHPDTWNILLGVLDDGRLTDSQGTTVSFGDSVVILTSNLLAEEIMSVYEEGGEVDDRAIKEGLVEAGIKREIVNRIGQIVTFHSLTQGDIKEIARRMLQKPIKQMRETHGVEVSFSEAAVEYLGELGYEPAFGSRPLRAVIEREVEDRLSDLVLDGKIGRGSAIEFDVREGSGGEPELGIRPARQAPR